MKHRNCPISEVGGHTLTSIINLDKQYERQDTLSYVPNASKLFNFDVKGGFYDLLVLDPYGDELLTQGLKKVLFGSDEYTVAIDRTTGVVYWAYFLEEDKGFSLTLSDEIMNVPNYSLKVPQSYLVRLDELKSKKRPFTFSISDRSLLCFVEREEGYQHLRENITLQLDFHPYMIEISNDMWREVGRWKDT